MKLKTSNNHPTQSSATPRSGSDFEAQFALVGPEYLIESRGTTAQAENLILLEAHFSSIDHPLDPEMPVFGHIPDAIQIHPSYLEAWRNRSKYYPFYNHPRESNLMPEAQLILALEHLGITPDSCVVVYGSDPDGVMAAARLVWGLMHAGVRTVRLLDGGLNAWIEHGQAPDAKIKNVWNLGEKKPDPSDLQKKAWNSRAEYLATMEDVQQIAAGAPVSQVGKLIDVRTEGEWNGTTPMKYPFFTRTGHIPGAIHQGDWENLMDGRTKRLAPHLDIVFRRWRKQGIIDDKVADGSTTLTFYCGTGWRSSIAFLVAHLLGLQARNYDNGFFGWSHNPDHPISTVSLSKTNHPPQAGKLT